MVFVFDFAFVFDCDFDSELQEIEHKLEYTQAYNNYKEMVEQEVDNLLKDAEIGQEKFIEALEDCKEREADLCTGTVNCHSAKCMLRYLDSLTDYDQFFGMVGQFVA